MAIRTTINLFKIIEINVNSLISLERRHNLKIFLNTHRPHLVLLVETVLLAKHAITFPNYHFVRSDKESFPNGRGTGILVRNDIKYDRINTRTWNLNSLETTAIQIRTQDNQNILAISAYRPRNNNGGLLDTTDLDTIMTHKRQINRCKIIIGGDFNARHQDWRNNKQCNSGLALANWLNTNNAFQEIMLVFSAEPTYYARQYSSHLDLFIVSEELNIDYPIATPNMLAILDYPSDHRAVELIFDLHSPPVKMQPIVIPNFSQTNWKQFNTIIDNGINDINIVSSSNMSANQIDTAVEEITSLINNTVDAVVPKIEIRDRMQLLIPNDLKHLINEKNRLRRIWQRKRYDHSAYLLRSEINNLEKIIRDRLKSLQTQQWQRALSDIKLDNHTFANIRKFVKSKRSNFVHALKNDPTATTLTCDTREKAAILGRHYEAVHRQNNLLGDAIFTTTVSDYVDNNLNQTTARAEFSQHASANPAFKHHHNRHLVSLNSLLAAITSRANKKSKGADNISNFLIKRLSPKFRVLLAILFNQAYNIAFFPTAWKIALVMPILKKQKPTSEPMSYRPISLLSCLGKLYERCIKQEIDEECERLKIIPDDQFSHKSTLHPLIKLTTDITTNLSKRTPTIACTLDVEKAFDTVWTDGLLYKLHHTFGVNTHICCLMKSYLTNRSFRVVVEHERSILHPIAAGVPQGGVLSSLLYSIYVSDLPMPPPNNHPIQRLQYADDILVYVSVMNLLNGQDRLSHYITQIQDFLTRWKIKLNPLKAESIVFKGTNKQHGRNTNFLHDKIALRLGQQVIPLQGDIKYLGVIFKKKPTFITHVNEAIRKATAAYHQLKHILRRTSKLDVSIKLLCYKQLIRPILCYGFPAWAGISSHQMERIRCFERKCIRACINYQRPLDTYKSISNVELYNTSKTIRADAFMINNAIKLFDRWPNSPLLQNCVDFDPAILDDPRTAYKPPWLIHHLHTNDQLFLDTTPMLYHIRHRPNLRHLGPVYSTAT